MTHAEAIALANEVIAKYGDAADKPSVHLAKALLEIPQIADELREEGWWRSCSGCHESDEGHPTGRYSDLFRCNLGIGCYECGGIGAVWEQFLGEPIADDACTTCGAIHTDVDCFGKPITSGAIP